MAIDVRSISITGAFNAIKSFFLSQENNSRWKDTETGADDIFFLHQGEHAVADQRFRAPRAAIVS